MIKNIIAFSILSVILFTNLSYACSRVLHTSEKCEFVVTARSMDWFEDIHSNLWVFPRGLERKGEVSGLELQWTSKYGSVITAGFDSGTSDGLNEKGLAVNLLYLAEANYGKRDKKRAGVSWSAYAQYLLDVYSNVSEAVRGEKEKNVQIVPSPLPGSSNKPPALHFSLSDSTGDSAIFEWINGEFIIHHGKQYNIMTNSPAYDQQLALNAYWHSVDGNSMLPGTRRAADRFVRASFYESGLPDPKNTRQALANAMSVIRSVSVPFSYADPEKPNLSSTIWRTLADNTNKTYYFESALSPSLVWVSLSEINLSEGQPSLKADLVKNPDYAGNLKDKLVVTKPFEFAGE